MRHYEIMVILDASLEERTVAPSLDTYLNVIRTAGGSVEKLDVWGRRRLSYEIVKKAEASTPSSTSRPRLRPLPSWTVSCDSTSPCCAPRSSARKFADFPAPPERRRGFCHTRVTV